jgi:sporulation protein YlmC with PRC-barrel domain
MVRWNGLGLAIAFIIGIAGSAQAQNDPQLDKPIAGKTTINSTGPIRIVRASEVIGKDVKNPQGENLGDVKDLVIDQDMGSIAYAVVSFGGFLGMGDKLFAVPWSALSRSGDKVLVLDVPKERLQKAPGFDKDAWPNFTDRAYATEVYTFYGRPAYWERTTTTETADGRKTVTTEKRTYPPGTFDQKNVRLVSGTITTVNENADDGMLVTVKKEARGNEPAGDAVVVVAPRWYLEKQAVVVKQNDPVSVKVVEVEQNGKKVLIATEITRGDKIVALRRDDGSPVWVTVADNDN